MPVAAAVYGLFCCLWLLSVDGDDGSGAVGVVAAAVFSIPGGGYMSLLLLRASSAVGAGLHGGICGRVLYYYVCRCVARLVRLLPVVWACIPLVIVSLRNVSDGGGVINIASLGDDGVRLVCSLLEKSGWFYSLRVSSPSCDLGSLAVLVASDPVSLGDVLASGLLVLLGRSASQVHIVVFDMPTEVALNLYVASLEASSSRWESASSCKLGTSLFQRCCVKWWLRLPVTKMTGRSLQGLGCTFSVSCFCPCKGVCVISMNT